MTKHLIPEKRRETILVSAMSLFCESGLDSINMSTLSEQTNITRQAIYCHFRNVDEVLEALCEQVYYRYYDVLEAYDPYAQFIADQSVWRVDSILDLPGPVRRLGAIAFFSGDRSRTFLHGFQRRFDELLHRNWIDPLIESGFPRAAATSTVYSIVASSFQCGELIDRGLITKFDAQSQLATMSDVTLQVPRRPLMTLVN